MSELWQNGEGSEETAGPGACRGRPYGRPEGGLRWDQAGWCVCTRASAPGRLAGRGLSWRRLPRHAATPRHAVVSALALSGCLPYSVGQTVKTAPRGELVVSQSSQFVPVDSPFEEGGADGGCDEDCRRAEAGGGSVSFGAEARVGLTERSDVGVRLVGGAGVGVTYKTRLTTGGPVAVSGSGGVLNVGQHASGEATGLASGPPGLASGPPGGAAVPYGGLRAFFTAPVEPDAVHDAPTVGASAGLRIGTAKAGLSAEAGVSRDPSALGLRERDVVVVLSVTVRGRGLFGGGPFGGLLGPRR